MNICMYTVVCGGRGSEDECPLFLKRIIDLGSQVSQYMCFVPLSSSDINSVSP